MSYKSSDHPIIKATAWEPEKEAERANGHILFSRGTSNSQVVLSDTGDVVINTGIAFQGARHRERFEKLAGRPLKVAKVIVTQSHPDHVGGWGAFADAGAETIVHKDFPWLWRERKMMTPFFMPRTMRIMMALMPKPEHMASFKPEQAREPETYTLVSEPYAFELGGRRFELLSAPSGETLDSLLVWLPQEKTLFTGNFMGALYGALPNFYTLRGDRARSVPGFLRDIERVIGLGAELLITGHDAPIVGRDRITADLTKLRDAVRHIHDETVKGMNAKRDLTSLMREIQLPANLKMAPGRGVVAWYVRAVWEEYTGWFAQENTAELYAVPARNIWSEISELAGADALVERAGKHVAAGRPVEALHFIDIALAGQPSNKAARQVQIDALNALLERTQGNVFDEIGWLETEIARAQAALKGAG